jgi:hypothetical protein
MLEHRYPTRVVNVRYTVNGLYFDAAIDCNWQLHAYSESPDVMRKRVPIELYCFDHQEWDIRMLYQDLPNGQPTGFSGEYYMKHTEVEWEEIIEETKKWIEEMTGQIERPEKPENNEEDILPLF